MEFNRLLEFCRTATSTTLGNDIRLHLQKGLLQVPRTFEPYELSLERLDEPTWGLVKQKLLQRTIKHPVRGWAQFFETLAEVRGYCYLLDLRYKDVNFISEKNNLRTPDIEGIQPNSYRCLLESKCIGFSDDERRYILENTRRIESRQVLDARDVIQGMPQGLKDKIEDTISSAKAQLFSYIPSNEPAQRIIFLTLTLDIHMYLNMNNYIEIVNFVRAIT